MHCDTILRCFEDGDDLSGKSGHISIDRLREGGCLAQCFALFVPSNDVLNDHYHFPDTSPWAIYHDLLECYRQNMSMFADTIVPALSAEDIRKNCEDGKMSSILTVEDGALLEGKLSRLDDIFSDGVRMLALTWNYENCIGYPNSEDVVLHTKTHLKEFGIEAVEKMNSLGMIIDVSHLSEGGFYDVAKFSSRPFAASHSCCRALCNHQRNLTDDQLRVIGDTGAVVGVNFYSVFLREDSDDTASSDVVMHMKHICNKAGIDSLALGSDFDGITCGLEFSDYAGYPRLIDAASRYFTADELDKICSGNFVRVFSAQNL